MPPDPNEWATAEQLEERQWMSERAILAALFMIIGFIPKANCPKAVLSIKSSKYAKLCRVAAATANAVKSYLLLLAGKPYDKDALERSMFSELLPEFKDIKLTPVFDPTTKEVLASVKKDEIPNDLFSLPKVYALVPRFCQLLITFGIGYTTNGFSRSEQLHYLFAKRERPCPWFSGTDETAAQTLFESLLNEVKLNEAYWSSSRRIAEESSKVKTAYRYRKYTEKKSLGDLFYELQSIHTSFKEKPILFDNLAKHVFGSSSRELFAMVLGDVSNGCKMKCIDISDPNFLLSRYVIAKPFSNVHAITKNSKEDCKFVLEEFEIEPELPSGRSKRCPTRAGE